MLDYDLGAPPPGRNLLHVASAAKTPRDGRDRPQLFRRYGRGQGTFGTRQAGRQGFKIESSKVRVEHLSHQEADV